MTSEERKRLKEERGKRWLGAQRRKRDDGNNSRDRQKTKISKGERGKKR